MAWVKSVRFLNERTAFTVVQEGFLRLKEIGRIFVETIINNDAF